jgi:hypothetical protein
LKDITKEVMANYDFYARDDGGIYPMIYDDEYHCVCFIVSDNDGREIMFSITDDHVYYSSEYGEAERRRKTLGGEIFALRHGDDDWSIVCSIEKGVLVNRLGYGIFIKKVK